MIAGIIGTDQGQPAAAVYINLNTGQLGTGAPPPTPTPMPPTSSRRFKKEIKPMEKASESVLALKPVTFHYNGDTTNTPQFGLIAEQVAAVDPDLVVRDKNGDIYTVRYDAVNAMLLNEFLKARQKMEEQGSIIAKQQRQIEALTSGLQKVSARLESSERTLQIALKDR
jgi:hypothetical protein